MAIGGTAEQRYELAPPHVGHEDFPHSVSRTAQPATKVGWKSSPAVNRADNDGPELIAPAPPASAPMAEAAPPRARAKKTEDRRGTMVAI
jgi:hypothetical protein